MDGLKLLIFISSIKVIAATNTHNIPIGEYKTELHDLGQHVEYPEKPVKVIKITKTIAVKIPVPYPVKIIEKVPYPVHVSKPYPLPVPQIVQVPQAGHTLRAHALHEPLGNQAAAPGESYPHGPHAVGQTSEDFSFYEHNDDHQGSPPWRQKDEYLNEYLKAHEHGRHGGVQDKVYC